MSSLARIKAKHEVKELFTETKPLVEEILEENTQFSLRDTKNKNKVLILEGMLIFNMFLIVVAAMLVLFGTFYGYLTDRYVLFTICILLMLMFITSWAFVWECRK